MQFKSLFIIGLAALCCAPAVAQRKGKKAKKAAKAAMVQKAPKLEPVDGKTFSYALGVAQGSSLKQYLIRQMGVDSANVAIAVEGMNSNLSEETQKRIEAFAAGLRIAQTNKHNMPMFNKQACGKADSVYVNESEFERGLSEVVLGLPTTYKEEAAIQVVEKQFKFQQNKIKLENLDWLEANKKQKGVKVLPSGLQYRILTEGKGPVATDSTEVEVNYEGSLIDGSVFDSSYKRGQSATFRPNQVIKGWREALTMMPEGSVWNLYIPADLGYGERGQGADIPGNSTLIFKVEVLKVKK